MSLKRNVEVTCPSCLIKSTTKLWDSINVTIDEELKEKILNNDFFKYKCPICGDLSIIEYDCLYHDMNRKEMIYLIRNYSKDNASLAKEMKALSEDILPKFGDDYKLRIVTSNKELIEKIKILDCNLDDRIIELYKLYYIDKKSDDNLVPCVEKKYFHYDITEDCMMFIYTDNKGNVLSYPLDMQAYHLVKDKYLNIIEKKEHSSFQVVDEQWAIENSKYNGD